MSGSWKGTAEASALFLTKREGTKLPQFLVRVRTGNEEEILYFATEKDLMSYAEENRDLRLFGEELTEEEDKEFKEKYQGAMRRAVKKELHEVHAIDRLLARINELGIDTDVFFSDDTPIYEVVDGEGEDQEVTPLFQPL